MIVVGEKKRSGARSVIKTKTKETEQKGDKLNVEKKTCFETFVFKY